MLARLCAICPDSSVGWPNIGPTSVLSSRRWANVSPTYIAVPLVRLGRGWPKRVTHTTEPAHHWATGLCAARWLGCVEGRPWCMLNSRACGDRAPGGTEGVMSQSPILRVLFTTDASVTFAGFMAMVVSNNFTATYIMMTSSNGNIFRVTGLLCGEFTPVNFPRKGQWRRAFHVFFDMCLNKRLIWDAIAPVMTSS